MNLARHISVLWRFRAVVGLGLLLGVVMAFLAAFQIPSMERRGGETWSAESSIFVTQTGFPWGRVTLGDTSAPGMPSAQTDSQDGSDTQYADPARFSNLALLYANLAQSDEVRGKLPGNPSREQIEPRVLDATGGGVSFLPIIKLTVTESSAAGAVKLNQAAIDAMQDYLQRNQSQSDTPADQRVRLEVINEPAGAALVSGRSLTIPFVAFLLCLLGAVAVAHILENLRPRGAALAVVPSEFAALPHLDDDEEYAAPAGHAERRNGHAVRYDAPHPSPESR
jgi:hypothetical protein